MKHKSNISSKNKLPLLSLAVLSFALFAVFGLSLITGNQQDSGVGSSLASAQEPADINSDAVVDIVDLSILLSNWSTADNLSDLNNDNIVDIVDLSVLLSKWGSVAAPPTANTAYERGLAWYQQNTGVPVGTVLTPSGSLNISTEGTVIDGLDVSGNITINAKNVTIRNTLVRGYISNNLRTIDANLLIEYSEVDMSGYSIEQLESGQYRAIGAWWGTTIRFVKSHGSAQGVVMSNYVTIEDSYIYNIRTGRIVHAENILSNGGGNNIVRRNWLDATDLTNSMAISGSLNMYGDFDIIHDNIIDGNYITGNRGYLFYPGAVTSKPYPLPSNLTITNNVIEPIPGPASYGPVYPSSLDTVSASKWLNNTSSDGTVIPSPGGGG